MLRPIDPSLSIPGQLCLSTPSLPPNPVEPAKGNISEKISGIEGVLMFGLALVLPTRQDPIRTLGFAKTGRGNFAGLSFSFAFSATDSASVPHLSRMLATQTSAGQRLRPHNTHAEVSRL